MVSLTIAENDQFGLMLFPNSAIERLTFSLFPSMKSAIFEIIDLRTRIIRFAHENAALSYSLRS